MRDGATEQELLQIVALQDIYDKNEARDNAEMIAWIKSMKKT